MRWFWMDRFTEFVSGRGATALKCVSLGEDHMHDHLSSYPMMPSSLMTEGMAQAGGLLVSEHYGFKELVVLGKISRARFYGPVRPGQMLTYRIEIDTLKEDGAAITATAHTEGVLRAETQLFFARMGETDPRMRGLRLFHQRDLLHWLNLVGLFEVGVRPDGTRLRVSDYSFDEEEPLDGSMPEEEVPCAGGS